MSRLFTLMDQVKPQRLHVLEELYALSRSPTPKNILMALRSTAAVVAVAVAVAAAVVAVPAAVAAALSVAVAVVVVVVAVVVVEL